MNIISNFSFGISSKFQKSQHSVIVSDSFEKPKVLNDELNKIAMVNKSQVNFCGKGFDFNKKDLMFLSSLASVFGLSSVIADKLKNRLGDFLQTNQLKSMDDMSGEDNLLLQSNLIDALNEVTNFKDKNYFKLIDKVFDRCDSEGEMKSDTSSQEGTIESLMDDDENDDISGEFDFELENLIKKRVERIKQNDKKCLEAIGAAFELDKEQQKKLEDIVNQTLKENHLSFLNDLDSEDMIETEIALVNNIADEFELSEDESIVISSELMNRALAKESYYEPRICPLDRNLQLTSRDSGLLGMIMERNGFKYNDAEVLSIAMKKDAYENGFKSIFDLFDNGNDFSKYKNVNKILNSEKFVCRKINLLIDLNLTAKNIKNEVAKMKQREKNANLNGARVDAFICELDNLYDFSIDEIKNIKNFITKSVKYDLGNKQNIGKIAYELSEYLHKESDYTQIAEIAKKVTEISQDDIGVYGFQYCQLLMRK